MPAGISRRGIGCYSTSHFLFYPYLLSMVKNGGECSSRCGLDRGTGGPDGKTVSTPMAPLQWIHDHLRASTLLQHENTISTGVFDGPYRISSVCSRNQGEPQSDGQSRTSGESTHLPRYCPTIRDISPCPYISNDAASCMRDEVDGLRLSELAFQGCAFNIISTLR